MNVERVAGGGGDMPQMYNPMTRTTYTVERTSDKVTSIRREADETPKRRPNLESRESFTRKHPRLAQLCLIMGLMTAACTMAIGLHELTSGERVEFVDTSPLHSRHIEDHQGFLENTFCKGGRTSSFCR